MKRDDFTAVIQKIDTNRMITYDRRKKTIIYDWSCIEEIDLDGLDINSKAKKTDGMTMLSFIARKTEFRDCALYRFLELLDKHSKLDAEAMSKEAERLADEFEILLLEKLIEHGANPNQYDDRGNKPIIYAFSENSLEVVKAFIKAGTTVDEKIKSYFHFDRFKEGEIEGYFHQKELDDLASSSAGESDITNL